MTFNSTKLNWYGRHFRTFAESYQLRNQNDCTGHLIIILMFLLRPMLKGQITHYLFMYVLFRSSNHHAQHFWRSFVCWHELLTVNSHISGMLKNVTKTLSFGFEFLVNISILIVNGWVFENLSNDRYSFDTRLLCCCCCCCCKRQLIHTKQNHLIIFSNANWPQLKIYLRLYFNGTNP